MAIAVSVFVTPVAQPVAIFVLLIPVGDVRTVVVAVDVVAIGKLGFHRCCSR